jgi:glutaminyl-tRNA synthetase
MPTISGLRRRVLQPILFVNFVILLVLPKRILSIFTFEFCLREDLNKTAPRVMAVLDPIKLVITNYPEDKEEWLEAENNQKMKRRIESTFSRIIEREDF